MMPARGTGGAPGTNGAGCTAIRTYGSTDEHVIASPKVLSSSGASPGPVAGVASGAAEATDAGLRVPCGVGQAWPRERVSCRAGSGGAVVLGQPRRVCLDRRDTPADRVVQARRNVLDHAQCGVQVGLGYPAYQVPGQVTVVLVQLGERHLRGRGERDDRRAAVGR